MPKQSYSEKLRDPRWQKKRLEIMQRADFKCEDCGAADKTLNVHHSLYETGREPWDASGSVLRCTCEDCHLPRQLLEREAGYSLRAVFATLTIQEIEAFRDEVWRRYGVRLKIRDGFVGEKEQALIDSGELTAAGLPPVA